jgi:hypothetical protein
MSEFELGPNAEKVAEDGITTAGEVGFFWIFSAYWLHILVAIVVIVFLWFAIVRPIVLPLLRVLEANSVPLTAPHLPQAPQVR